MSQLQPRLVSACPSIMGRSTSRKLPSRCSRQPARTSGSSSPTTPRSVPC